MTPTQVPRLRTLLALSKDLLPAPLLLQELSWLGAQISTARD